MTTNEEKESRLMTKDSNDPITILTAALVLLPERPTGKDLFAAVKLERAISYLTGDENYHHGDNFVLADKVDVLACPACSSLQPHQEILSGVAVVGVLQFPFECQNCGGVNYFDFKDK